MFPIVVTLAGQRTLRLLSSTMIALWWWITLNLAYLQPPVVRQLSVHSSTWTDLTGPLLTQEQQRVRGFNVTALKAVRCRQQLRHLAQEREVLAMEADTCIEVVHRVGQTQ
jgi:hypothetical protein